MFDQSWRLLSRQLLRRQAPRRRLDSGPREVPPAGHARRAMKEDLYALVSLMLGELNASHLGITGNLPHAGRSRPPTWA